MRPSMPRSSGLLEFWNEIFTNAKLVFPAVACIASLDEFSINRSDPTDLTRGSREGLNGPEALTGRERPEFLAEWCTVGPGRVRIRVGHKERC